jgi:hypothetical protein
MSTDKIWCHSFHNILIFLLHLLVPTFIRIKFPSLQTLSMHRTRTQIQTRYRKPKSNSISKPKFQTTWVWDWAWHMSNFITMTLKGTSAVNYKFHPHSHTDLCLQLEMPGFSFLMILFPKNIYAFDKSFWTFSITLECFTIPFLLFCDKSLWIPGFLGSYKHDPWPTPLLTTH